MSTMSKTRPTGAPRGCRGALGAEPLDREWHRPNATLAAAMTLTGSPARDPSLNRASTAALQKLWTLASVFGFTEPVANSELAKQLVDGLQHRLDG